MLLRKLTFLNILIVLLLQLSVTVFPTGKVKNEGKLGQINPDQIEALNKVQIAGKIINGKFGTTVTGLGDINGDGYNDIAVSALNHNSGMGRVYIYYGPVRSSSTAKTLDGEATGNSFGISITSAGDLNRDGYADFAIGASGFSNGRGKVYIYFGGANGDLNADLTIVGENPGDSLGCSVSDAGDFNKDGFGDLIAGASGYNSGTGRAYIFYGGKNMNAVADVIKNGETIGDKFGCSVSAAGDFTLDGYDDVLIGAYGYNSFRGRAYLYYGSTNINSTAGLTMTGESSNSYFGYSVDGGGDYNGDFYSDIVIGAYGYNVFTGRVYLYLGNTTPGNSPNFIMNGETSSSNFGFSVAFCGDLETDGYTDLAVGAYGYSGNTGKIYVYSGSAVPDAVADESLPGDFANSNLGYSVAGCGDLDGQGYSNLLTGANNFGNGKGAVYLIKRSISTTANYKTYDGFAVNKNYASVLDGDGDFNGDGYSDLVVGERSQTSTDTGRVYLYLGGPGKSNTPDYTFVSDQAGSYFGRSVRFAGDLNGDGYSDLMISASAYNSRRGRIYIYFGGAIVNTVPDLIIDGEAATNDFGMVVSPAGDVNGDGYADIITGTKTANASMGRVYIYYGGANMDSVADVIVSGTATGLNWGEVVSNAGDVNSDGYDDVLISATSYSTSTGRAFLLFGGAPMDNVIDVTLTGTSTNSMFSSAMAPAGDVNGDGYKDFIIGAYAYSTSTGRVFIFYGGSTVSTTAAVTLTGSAASSRFGWAVSSAGDQNLDGYDDIVVSSLMVAGDVKGRVDIYYGGASMDATADVTYYQTPSEQYGFSLSKGGDQNGDEIPEIIVGNNGNSNSLVGKVYQYYSISNSGNAPRILSVKDIPNDQGGRVQINWLRSKNDVIGDTILTGYVIERSLPPGISGFSWEQIAVISPMYNVNYSYSAPTVFDSLQGFEALCYYRITAKGLTNKDLWKSNIMPGYSVDNLAPATITLFKSEPVTGGTKLSWTPNRDPDFYAYYIYRASTARINADTLSPLTITRDTVFTDYFLNKNNIYYFIRSRDVNGNFSAVSSNSNNPLPVELVNFTAYVNGKTITLNWKTHTEVNVISFMVERKSAEDPDWRTVGEVTGAGNSNSQKEYYFSNEVPESGTYYYRLGVKEADGFVDYTNALAVTAGIPIDFKLAQNYPNPFNPETRINFQIPMASTVKIEIYDMLGNIVKTLVDERKEAGYYSVMFSDASLPSGTYFYKIEAGKFRQVKKMVLIK